MYLNDYLVQRLSEQVQEARLKEARQARLARLADCVRRSARDASRRPAATRPAAAC